MAQSTGKKFEINWSKSAPEYVLVYRVSDSAQAFGGSSKLRFSRKNPFDFIMWDSQRHVLYALELKTVNGKSISFERNKEEHGEIHYHQIVGLNEWNKYDGIICGFVIEFRASELTIFLDIAEFNKLIDAIEKKSFGVKDLDENNICYLEIPQVKKRVNYKYDLERLLNNFN